MTGKTNIKQIDYYYTKPRQGGMLMLYRQVTCLF